MAKTVARMVTLQETKYEEIFGSPEHERHGDADTLEEVSPNQRRRRRGGLDCRCDDSWRMRCRNVWRGPDCHYRNSWPKARRNAAGTTILSPRTCVNASGGAEPERKETTVTAGNTRTTSVPVFLPPPRYPAACQRSDPSESSQPCLLAPSIHQEVRNRVLVRCPVNSGRDGGEDSSSS